MGKKKNQTSRPRGANQGQPSVPGREFGHNNAESRDIVFDASRVEKLLLSGQYDEAMAMIQVGVQADAQGRELLQGWGRKLMERQQFDGAASVHRRLTELFPKDSKAFNALAVALTMVGELDQALMAMKMANDLDPDTLSNALNLGKLHMLRKEWPQALTYLEKAIYRTEDELREETQKMIDLCRDSLQTQETGATAELKASFTPPVEPDSLHHTQEFLARQTPEQPPAPSPAREQPATPATPKAPAAPKAASPAPAPSGAPLAKTDRPLNILFAQESPCIRNYKMATALKARGHRVSLAYAHNKLSQMYKGLSDDVYEQCLKLSKPQDIWELSEGYDLVHCHNEPDVLSVAALGGSVPVVHDTHDLISLRQQGDSQLAFLEGLANRAADGRVYSTPYQRDEARRLYNATGPSLVLYNYASRGDLPRERLPKRSAADGGVHLVYEGGIGGDAHRDFTQLFADLDARGVHVHIYPPADNPQLNEYFSRHAHIHVHPSCSPRDIIQEMSQYDYGIIPFNLEKGDKRFLDSTIANKLFEYLAAGLPVATSGLQSYVDFFAKNPVGFVFENAEDIVNGLDRLAELARTVDFAAQVRTYEDEVTRLEEFYLEVIRRGGPGSRRRASSGDEEEDKSPEADATAGDSTLPEVQRREFGAPRDQAPARSAQAAAPPAAPAVSADAPWDQAALERLLAWLESNGWDGYDPYDLQDYLIRRAMAGRGLPPERQQEIMQRGARDPMGMRRELGIGPKRIAKGLGLLGSARVRLYKVDGRREHLEEATRLAEWLLQHPSPGHDNLCWGYPFEWQSVIMIPKDTPSAVVSTAAGDLMWELYTVTRQERWLEACRSICRFITQDLKRDDMGEQGLCFSYTPIDDYHVHNANLFCGEFLARVGREIGDQELMDLAARTADYALAEQNPDGSIFYWGRVQNQYAPNKLDHYHSGFEIRCLFHISEHLRSEPVRQACLRYLDFYLQHFLLEDGTPKITPGQPYPVDIHGAAEAVLMLSTLGRERPKLLDLAEKSLRWTVEKMQTDQGWFAYQWTPDFRADAPYLRWGQAWMLRAMSEYFAARLVRSGTWGYRGEVSSQPGRKADPDARDRDQDVAELWALARDYRALGGGAAPGFVLQALAERASGGRGPADIQALQGALDDPQGWRGLLGDAPEAGGRPESDSAASEAVSSPDAAPPPARVQIMMPDTQQAAYGSRQWAERLFQGAEGDPWGHDWRASQKGRYRKALEMVRAGADPGRVKSVLDIGCALGHFTVMLADCFQDARVLGVDISPEAVRKCAAAHPDLEFLTAQLPELDLGGRDFDFISALEVIYYVGPENIDRSLARIRQALKPGGLLLISSYLNKPPFNTAAVFREAVGKHFTVEREEIRHHNLYTQFENLVRQACDQTTQLNALASPEGRKRIDSFVRAGVELLGDEDLLERLNDYARERLGDQSISHSILLARRES